MNVVGLDGGGLTRIASGVSTPSWSPDGTRLAYAGGSPGNLDIHVVGADGEGDVLLADGPGAQLEPKWSPEGTNIAFLTQPAAGTEFGLAVARADGSGLQTYPEPGVSNPYSFAWSPGGRAIVYARGATQGIFRLDLTTGATSRLTAFGGTPAVSPDGARIAFAGGGECRDRTGIYVMAATGGRPYRLTNDCRIVGTSRADVLRGADLADVLVGLGGDDRLIAFDSAYVGDTLLGGDGNDLLVGAGLDDVLDGGRASDRLLGGNSADEVDDGAGRDRIDGQRGNDRVRARDGFRDMVTCGTNQNRRGERDEVWADRFDRVSRDCELVHRTR